MTTETKTALVPYVEMERMASAIAQSGLFGMKTKEQALALMCVAQAEGRHPGSVATEYHIIQGRPALKADTMLARFQQAGGKVEWTSYTDECVAAVFTHPSGGNVEIDWTLARAKAAGLTEKDIWKAYPRHMLRARVISEGVRTVYPGVALGIYTSEEVMDFEPVKSVGPVTVDHATGEVVATPAARKGRKPITRKPTPVAPAVSANGAVDTAKVIVAFQSIGIDQQTVEGFMLKPIVDWTLEDVATARDIYFAKRKEAMEQAKEREVI